MVHDARGGGNSSGTDPLLLTAQQAADLLTVSKRTLWALTNRRAVPHVRIGRSVRYPAEALRAWVAEQTEGGGR